MTLLRLVTGVLVTFIWSAAWIAAIIRSDYTGVGLVTPVMLLVVGALFGGDAIRLLRTNGNEKGK